MQTHDLPDIPDTKVLEFVVFCVENLAAAEGLPAQHIYQVLRSSGVLSDFVVHSYGPLHTQSKEYILEDIRRALADKKVSL